MDTVSVNQFRDNLKTHVETVIRSHEPLKVSRRNGEDFVVISLEDWEREQETLYVLQDEELMKQIAKSMKSYSEGGGYRPTEKELDEINSI